MIHEKYDNQRVIVSMTSFPEAIMFATDAIRSILQGTFMPDKIVLYLTASQFCNKNIPEELLNLVENNPIIEIRYYEEDIRSYTKLIPALIDFPDAIIVTIDDDIWYNKNMLRCLLKWHNRFPNAIISHRSKRIKVGTPYRKWKKYRWYDFLMTKSQPNFNTLQTGVMGVLYPPNSLKQEMLDPIIFKKIAPTVDDLWFWAAAVANETSIFTIPFGYNKSRSLNKPKEISLKTINVNTGLDRNRDAIEKILKMYPVIEQRLLNSEDNSYNYLLIHSE